MTTLRNSPTSQKSVDFNPVWKTLVPISVKSSVNPTAVISPSNGNGRLVIGSVTISHIIAIN